MYYFFYLEKKGKIVYGVKHAKGDIFMKKEYSAPNFEIIGVKVENVLLDQSSVQAGDNDAFIGDL